MEAAEDADSQDDVERIHVSTLIMQIVERSEILLCARWPLKSSRLWGARYTSDYGLVEVLSS